MAREASKELFTVDQRDLVAMGLNPKSAAAAFTMARTPHADDVGKRFSAEALAAVRGRSPHTAADAAEDVTRMSASNNERERELTQSMGPTLAKVAAGTKFAEPDTPSWAKGTGHPGVCDAGAFARRLGMGYAEFMSSGIATKVPPDAGSGGAKLWKRETVEAFAKRLDR